MGQPVVHWEMMSKDPAKVSSFYETIFGWKVQHRPELNYRIVDTGGAERHQRRHLQARSRRAVARQHDAVHQCR